ncbi:GNAT family N-acetyltransferase [Gimesia sp.]|uniref:GNAT family N-acetyltransferase n=1 Tax=Gimesia sp. TaxID=2024833 RepID=UPI000C66AEB6|nr:GNAT family N-acetyltransferase [Gimesia sp.]MAX38473.1 GNAT family N-acetyltransferase [Gimesia sp.]HAH43294.1 GNAT family N-acetyltransferase [Planctomycetaceae bacterium]HBL43771.1 GNAT family N-acetyltransferase [Planctomycetaceae bacterium]|tara:strand:- start:3020 stop:3514 length:495 start_codon:yes stop_codon:yes gene_type:complete
MNFRVRQIELDDLAGFREALTRVAAERKYLLTVEPPSLENMEAYVRHNIEQNHAQYVALVEQRIVGWADLIPHARETVRHVARLGMGVLPECRGQGIGNQLLERAMAHAWEQGLKRLELEVFSTNEVALNLYRKHGYQVEGVKRFARCIDGEYQDIVVMGQYRI